MELKFSQETWFAYSNITIRKFPESNVYDTYLVSKLQGLDNSEVP